MKITYAELVERLRDPDVPEEEIRPFVSTRQVSGATAPRLVPNPEKVEMPAAVALKTEAEIGLGFLNAVYRARRKKRFERRLANEPTMPVLLAEGDSWFEYPLFLKDVIDQLDGAYNIRCLSAAGDQVVDMRRDGEYASKLSELLDRGVNVQAFMISAGGNDVAGEHLLKMIQQFSPGKPAAWYVDTVVFEQKMMGVLADLRAICEDVEAIRPGLPVLIHGYDYALPLTAQGFHVPPKDGWLGEPLRRLSIHDAALQAGIVREMIDRMNDALEKLAGGNAGGLLPNVHYVDNRNVVQGRWNDELHPNDDGFRDVAENFASVLKTAGVP